MGQLVGEIYALGLIRWRPELPRESKTIANYLDDHRDGRAGYNDQRSGRFLGLNWLRVIDR